MHLNGCSDCYLVFDFVVGELWEAVDVGFGLEKSEESVGVAQERGVDERGVACPNDWVGVP